MPPLQPWVLLRAPVLPHLLRQEPCIPTRTLSIFLAVPPFAIIDVAVGLRVDACPRQHPHPTAAPPPSNSPLIKIQPPPAPLIYAPHLQSLPLDRTASFLHLQPPAQHPRPRPMPPAHPSRSPSRPRPIPSPSLLRKQPLPDLSHPVVSPPPRHASRPSSPPWPAFAVACAHLAPWPANSRAAQSLSTVTQLQLTQPCPPREATTPCLTLPPPPMPPGRAT